VVQEHRSSWICVQGEDAHKATSLIEVVGNDFSAAGLDFGAQSVEVGGEVAIEGELVLQVSEGFYKKGGALATYLV
jgi:hypothetical protein